MTLSDEKLDWLTKKLMEVWQERERESTPERLCIRIQKALSYENIHSDRELRECARAALPYLQQLVK